MNDGHRIAFLRENVHMLHVVDLVGKNKLYAEVRR
jgi:hypothetical protein